MAATGSYMVGKSENLGEGVDQRLQFSSARAFSVISGSRRDIHQRAIRHGSSRAAGFVHPGGAADDQVGDGFVGDGFQADDGIPCVRVENGAEEGFLLRGIEQQRGARPPARNDPRAALWPAWRFEHQRAVADRVQIRAQPNQFPAFSAVRATLSRISLGACRLGAAGAAVLRRIGGLQGAGWRGWMAASELLLARRRSRPGLRRCCRGRKPNCRMVSVKQPDASSGRFLQTWPVSVVR